MKIGGDIGRGLGQITNPVKDMFSGLSMEKVAGAQQTPVGTYEVSKEKEERSRKRRIEREEELRGTMGEARPEFQMERGQQQEFRQRQKDLVDQLTAASMGEGPSAAQAQLEMATDRNLRQALALARSQRGGNPALAMRQAQQRQAEAGLEAGQQAAILRAQEQQAARDALAGALQTGRSQDIDIARSQLQADLEGQRMSDAMRQFYESQITGQREADLASALAYEQLRKSAFETAETARVGQFGQAQKAKGDLLRSVLSGIAGVGAAAASQPSGGAAAV